MHYLLKRSPPSSWVVTEHVLVEEGALLVRHWSDSWGGVAGEARPLQDLQALIEWVGAEDEFHEIVWRDGATWRISPWFGRPLEEHLGAIMAKHGLRLRAERRGLVLRSPESLVQPVAGNSLAAGGPAARA
ncbi:MAG: hypothetical protein JSR82_08290 [Verrucomicrobia bacterium]|nr:hypothetical protein [Verrucomicrobiota bacterium]MBS0658229.1 hypothetical protein [Verrucomicrobiota bacterium]